MKKISYAKWEGKKECLGEDSRQNWESWQPWIHLQTTGRLHTELITGYADNSQSICSLIIKNRKTIWIAPKWTKWVNKRRQVVLKKKTPTVTMTNKYESAEFDYNSLNVVKCIGVSEYHYVRFELLLCICFALHRIFAPVSSCKERFSEVDFIWTWQWPYPENRAVGAVPATPAMIGLFYLNNIFFFNFTQFKQPHLRVGVVLLKKGTLSVGHSCSAVNIKITGFHIWSQKHVPNYLFWNLKLKISPTFHPMQTPSVMHGAIPW